MNNKLKVNVEPYLQKFPHTQGKIPALEGPNVAITEVLAVATVRRPTGQMPRRTCSRRRSLQYLASINGKANLLGRSKEENAEVLQWSSLVNAELHPLAGAW